MEKPPEQPQSPEEIREHLIAAAICWKGRFFTGMSHKEARRQLQLVMEAQDPELKAKTDGDFEKFEYFVLRYPDKYGYKPGFVSNLDIFYDRLAAVPIAKGAGQIDASYPDDSSLTSEDVNWEKINTPPSQGTSLKDE